MKGDEGRSGRPGLAGIDGLPGLAGPQVSILHKQNPRDPIIG